MYHLRRSKQLLSKEELFFPGRPEHCLKLKFVIKLVLGWPRRKVVQHYSKNRAFSEKLKLKFKDLTQATEIRLRMFDFKVAPYSFLTARELISKISRWRELSNSTPKSRAESRSKMPTNMASKFLKFVYRKCCVDRLRFQNIYRLNRRPYLSLLDLKEKCTRYMYVGVPTN